MLREAFASRDADVIAVRFTADRPGALTALITLVSKQDGVATTVDAGGRRMGFAGTMANNLTHAAAVRIAETDGEVVAAEGGLRVSGAASITLLLDARTDYRLSAAHGWRGAAPQPAIEKALNAAASRSWKSLRSAHTAQVSELMQRAKVEWGSPTAP